MKYNNWKIWLLIAFMAKATLFFICHQKQDRPYYADSIGVFLNDTPSYLGSVENWIDNGVYSPDFRLPGYGAIYAPFYYFFSKTTALNLFILFQVLCAALSTYIIALIARNVFGNDKYFYLTFILYTISSNANVYDGWLITESLSTSFLVFSIYTFFKYLDTEKSIWLGLSGLINAEIVFLRPVFAPILLIFLFVLIWQVYKRKKKILKAVLIFLIPFIIIDGAWIYRNYVKYDEVFLLTRSGHSPLLTKSVIYPIFNFYQSFGGIMGAWSHDVPHIWFATEENPRVTIQIPEEIYTSQFNRDSLFLLQKLVREFQTDTSRDPFAADDALKNKITLKLNKYSQSIKEEKPYIYYVQSRWTYFKRFLRPLGSYNIRIKNMGIGEMLSNENTNFRFDDLILKLFYSFYYLFILFVGFLGIFFLLKQAFSFGKISVLSGIVIYTLLVHPILLKIWVERYFVPVWPILILFVSYMILLFNDKIRLYRQR